MSKQARLYVLDLDGTTTQDNSWQRLNLAMGVTEEEDQFYYDAYHRGEITFSEWTDHLIKIFLQRGNPTRQSISRVLQDFTFFPGVREAVKELQAQGDYVALVSAATDIFVKAVGRELGAD